MKNAAKKGESTEMTLTVSPEAAARKGVTVGVNGPPPVGRVVVAVPFPNVAVGTGGTLGITLVGVTLSVVTGVVPGVLVTVAGPFGLVETLFETEELADEEPHPQPST